MRESMQPTRMPNSSPQESVIYKGVRVNLISEDGKLEVLLLPRAVEGKYLFYKSEDHEPLTFVTIEAENGKWIICCNSNSCFLSEYAANIHRVPLEEKHLYYLTYAGMKYILCAEHLTTRSSGFQNYRGRLGAVITIGRAEGHDIVSAGRFISRNHAAICLTETGWEIRDLGSANGVYVNRRRVNMAHLQLGDSIYLMGVRILVGTDFLSICPGDNEIRINPAVLTLMEDIRSVGSKPSPVKKTLFNRSPRSRFSMQWTSIEVDAPPMAMTENKMPLILRMGSSAVMGGRSILMGSYSMALTSLFFPFLTQRYSDKERKEYEERRTAKYTEYLAEKRKQIKDECIHEYTVLTENYPPLDALFCGCKGKRLWERRKQDDDFLTLRIGSGIIPMQAKLEYPNHRFEMEQDTLEEQMFELAEKTYLIEKAPVMVCLAQDYVIGVVGNRAGVLEFIRSLISQLVTTHSYDEVKCIFLAEEQELFCLQEICYLPHIWNDERSIRFVATDQPGACVIGEYLRHEVEDDLGEGKGHQKFRKIRPHYVVFALSKRLYDSIEVLKDILMEDEYIGFSLVTAYDELPKECTKVYQMRKDEDGPVCFDLLHPDLPPQKFMMDRYDLTSYEMCMKYLANTRLKTLAGNFRLPEVFTFLEMFGVGRIEHLNFLKRWSESDPSRSLSTPIGIGTDGELFTLDLHEKRQGPHGLIAGMTGSGKSEFIITYILSMAVNFSPDEVAFLLIDYKGGGLTGAFENKEVGIHLPHLVGTITNLDGAEVTRSMISIESELNRRQRLFNEAKTRCNEGTMDIYTYQHLYRSHRVTEPLPHLFIISDEFAELKSQQPEFMDKLISTARIGRSLGVHLILATQKPAGVVNDQIWSNTRFRVCLRVQSKNDSQDMLKRGEAAELKQTGRFYLQVGYNEYFALGQSAWCGAEYRPQNEVATQKDESVQIIDCTGQVMLSAKPVRKSKSVGVTQLVAIVKHLSELAKRENIVPRKLLPPSLPRIITFEQLKNDFPDNPDSAALSAQVGIIDDPVFQKQYSFEIDLLKIHNLLLVGESGCGKTTLVQTLLLSLAERYTPEQVNFYILDFSSKLFSTFMYLPHCGAVLTDEDEAAIDRMFERIKEETARRQKLFVQAQVNNYEIYRRIHPLPLILVIIDGMVNFTSIKKGNHYYSTLQDYMREGAAYGIKFILTGSHFNEFSTRVRQEAGTHLGMSLKDRYSYYDVLGARTNYQPPNLPGRGMCIWEDRPLEFQTAVFTLEKDPRQAAQQMTDHLKKIAGMNTEYCSAARLPKLSESEQYTEFCRQFTPGRIPLGYTLDTIKPVSLPLKQLFSMSLYFGNPLGVEPVMDNLLKCCCEEQMELIIIRRKQNSLFSTGSGLLEWLCAKTKVTLLESCNDDISSLVNRLVDCQTERARLRNEYAKKNLLDETDPELALQAFNYIREHTTPLMVVFERFYEFAAAVNQGQGTVLSALFKAAPDDDDDVADPAVLWRRGRGYNLYYMGCFFPGDINLVNAQTPLANSFNPQKLILMFGGRLDKVGLMDLTREHKSATQMSDKYNRFLMYYNGKFASLMMPCGELIQPESNPDDDPIV